MKTVVSEKPAIATAFLPKRLERAVEHNTPSTVTNWLDILNRLNPTEATFDRFASTIRPKVFRM